MDALEFIAALSAAFAWPVAVVVLGLSQKEPISRLIDRIKSASLFGADLGMSDKLEAIRETIEEATANPAANPFQEPPPAVDEVQGDQLHYAEDEMARSSATGTIILAWVRLEQGIRQIAEINQLTPTDNFPRTLRALQDLGVISKSTAHAINQLRQLRNQVNHSLEKAVSLQEALAFRDTVDDILRSIGLSAGQHSWR